MCRSVCGESPDVKSKLLSLFLHQIRAKPSLSSVRCLTKKSHRRKERKYERIKKTRGKCGCGSRQVWKRYLLESSLSTTTSQCNIRPRCQLCEAACERLFRGSGVEPWSAGRCCRHCWAVLSCTAPALVLSFYLLLEGVSPLCAGSSNSTKRELPFSPARQLSRGRSLKPSPGAWLLSSVPSGSTSL